MGNEKVETSTRTTKNGKKIAVKSYDRKVETIVDEKGGVAKKSSNVKGLTPTKNTVLLGEVQLKNTSEFKTHFTKIFPDRAKKAEARHLEVKSTIERIKSKHQKSVISLINRLAK